MDIQLLGGLLGLLLHIPLLIGIWKNRIEQSFASYALWSTLDGIATMSLIAQNGNFWLSLFYSIGAGLVAISLLIKKQFSWSKFESFVSFLIIICLVTWYYSGPFLAMISSVSALSIASVPQIIDTLKKPQSTPTILYCGFCTANLLSFIGGSAWVLEQKLYSAAALIICSTITILSLRKQPHI